LYSITVCTKNRDIAILLENTDSIGGSQAFEMVKSFAAELAGAFQVSRESTHVALATYRGLPTTIMRFSDTSAQNRGYMLNKIRNIAFQGGKVGSTTAALEAAVNLFNPQNGARDNMDQVSVNVILLKYNLKKIQNNIIKMCFIDYLFYIDRGADWYI
jgi:hypothetical protein